MPTIVNAYKPDTSIADSLTKLGETMFGPGALQASLYREKAKGLVRENENLPLAAEALARGDVNGAIRHAVLGGMTAANTAGFNRLGTVSRAPSIEDPSVTRSMLAAGDTMASTPQGFATSQKTELEKANMATQRSANAAIAVADNTPVSVVDPASPNGFRTVSRREAIASGLAIVPSASDAEGLGKLRVLNPQPGQQPMTDVQLKAAGALPPADKTFNYVITGPNNQPVARGVTKDGATDMHTGQPLQGGQVQFLSPGNSGGVYNELGKPVVNQLQTQNTALAKLQEVSNYTRSLIAPDRVGLPGYVKGAAQDALQIAGGMASAFGYTGMNDAIADVQRRAAEKGVDPGVLGNLFTFDPKLPQLSTAYYGLVMTAADALAGGNNRASDRDIAIIKNMLGNPDNLFANPDQMNAKLDGVFELAQRLNKVNTQAIQTGGQSAAAPPQAATPPNATATGVTPDRGFAGNPQSAQGGAIDWKTYFGAPQ